jgi:hypothetical protein
VTSPFGIPEPRDYVILDRIEPGRTPPYCTHGRATCVGGCGEWVWLGDKTHGLVASRSHAPLCRQCANRLIPPGVRPARRVEDHRRADGPHA